jgi:hypothetical protein
MTSAIRVPRGRARATGTRRRPTPEELRTVLADLLPRGRTVRRIVDIETRPLPYASSFAIEELDVRFDDDSQIDLVCKRTGDAAMLPEARRIKPTFLRNPLREIATYEWILDPFSVGAPRFYGALIDRPRGRYWMFLERVNGPPLSEVGDFEVWLQVASWLARMHTDMQRHQISPPSNCVPLVRYDRRFHRRWMRRAQRFLQDDSASETRSRRERFRWLASRYEAIVDEIGALPVAFVHGEFYASNILVEFRSGEVRVRPLDWELAGIGCPLMDLAALTAGWSEVQQRKLAFRYYTEVSPEAPTWLPFDVFARALDGCRAQLAVQCLGWASRWMPPRPHSQDWLNEALQAAERLGL